MKDALEVAYYLAIKETAMNIKDSAESRRAAAIALESVFGEVLGIGFIRITKDLIKEMRTN